MFKKFSTCISFITYTDINRTSSACKILLILIVQKKNKFTYQKLAGKEVDITLFNKD